MIVRVQRGCISCAKLGGTAEVLSFCPSKIRIRAFFNALSAQDTQGNIEEGKFMISTRKTEGSVAAYS